MYMPTNPKEYWKAYRAKYPGRLAASQKTYYLKNKKRIIERALLYKKKIKYEVIGHYSGNTFRCKCCSEDTYEFLSIDHIAGGGNRHRKEIGLGGGGSSMYKWLRYKHYPTGFQVLCYNCNLAKGFFGECPHKKLRKT